MFKKMYLLLFNRITDAICALEHGDTEQAKDVLFRAQQEAEELYIEKTENGHPSRKALHQVRFLPFPRGSPRTNSAGGKRES